MRAAKYEVYHLKENKLEGIQLANSKINKTQFEFGKYKTIKNIYLVLFIMTKERYD